MKTLHFRLVVLMLVIESANSVLVVNSDHYNYIPKRSRDHE